MPENFKSKKIFLELDHLRAKELKRDKPRLQGLVDFERLVATTPREEMDSVLAKMDGPSLLALQKSLHELNIAIRKRGIPPIRIEDSEDDPEFHLSDLGH